jgi:hypothetical protein
VTPESSGISSAGLTQAREAVSRPRPDLLHQVGDLVDEALEVRLEL